jgi:hypothetical protein
MQVRSRSFAIAAALIAGLGIASAQTGSPGAEIDQTVGSTNPATRLELTPTQRRAILHAVRQENKKVIAPAELKASVGAAVPPSMELYVLPDRALMEAPAAKGFKYTVVQKQVMLIDPTNMRVVDVIGD